MTDKIKHRRSSLTGAAPVAGVADDYGILSGNVADKKLFMADAAGVSVLMSQHLEEYSAVRKYAVGDLCIQADSIYRCIVAVDPVGAFDALKWEVLGPAVLPAVAFKATRATAWAIAPGVWYPAQPNQEVYDHGGHFDIDTGRWTPPAGKVAMGFYGDMTGNIVASRTYIAAIYKNGAIYAFERRHCMLTSAMGVAIHLEDEANGTDYYEAFINADQAGSGNKTLGAGVLNTAFYGHVIAESVSGGGGGGGGGDAEPFVGFSVHRNNVAQGLGISTIVTIAWTHELYDEGAYFDTVTSRYTPPAGWYFFDLIIYGAGTGADNNAFTGSIRKNGSEDVGSAQNRFTPSTNSAHISALVYLNGTDYIDTTASAQDGTDLNGAIAYTKFSGFRISGTGIDAVITTPGKGDVVRHDGSKFVNQKTPYPILTGRVAGKPVAGAVLLDINVDAEVAFLDGLPDTLITGLTAATAIADFKLWRGGNATDPLVDGATLIGTIRVAAAGLVGAGVAGGGNFTLTLGQRLRLTAPAAQDATLADVSASIHGYRQ